MNPLAIMYLTYATTSICTTAWVGHTLHKNGRIFLIDAFHQNIPLADSVNHLLIVGFYLINIGLITLALKTTQTVSGLQDGIEVFSNKFGNVLVLLGLMHFFNIFVFSKMREGAANPPTQTPPPLPPLHNIPKSVI